MLHQAGPLTTLESSVAEKTVVKYLRGRIALLMCSAILLALAFAPYGQFYLAWIGLVPWLLVVASCRSQRSAFIYGWLGGVFYFIANLSYLLMNTIPGTIALSMYLALFWGTAAVLIRGGGLLRDRGSGTKLLGRVLGIATIWIAMEYLRGIILTGLPWHFLGHTQTPVLALCQIADVTGVYGLSFYCACINATIALAMLSSSWRRTIPAAVVTCAIVFVAAGYGLFRLKEQTTYPGPRVLVVQPDHPQRPGGTKSVTQEQSLAFHLQTTQANVKPDQTDLIVWSETTMPPLNQEARDELGKYQSGQFLMQVHAELMSLTSRLHTAILAGGYYVGGWREINGKRTGTDIRNAAFFYSPAGRQIARYDKVHLVPFGELIPFKQSIPWVYRFFTFFSPHADDYILNAGSDLTIFPLAFSIDDGTTRTSRFVAPICWDGSDAGLVSRMFRSGNLAVDVARDPSDPAPAEKKADFIVTLSNDGWFRLHQRPQHLQMERFRSIENRAPAARCVNTGISGFVDSCGRVAKTLAPHTVGVSSQRLMLDRRLTFYTRFGDVFALACVFASAIIAIIALVQSLHFRRGHHAVA
jgi:apolipoprotein N-acyltransferase